MFLATCVSVVFVITLCVFAHKTTIDLTPHGWKLVFSLIFICLISLIVGIFLPSILRTLLFSSLGAVIISLYLVYDTQTMIGMKIIFHEKLFVLKIF